MARITSELADSGELPLTPPEAHGGADPSAFAANLMMLALGRQDLDVAGDTRVSQLADIWTRWPLSSPCTRAAQRLVAEMAGTQWREQTVASLTRASAASGLHCGRAPARVLFRERPHRRDIVRLCRRDALGEDSLMQTFGVPPGVRNVALLALEELAWELSCPLGLLRPRDVVTWMCDFHLMECLPECVHGDARRAGLSPPSRLGDERLAQYIDAPGHIVSCGYDAGEYRKNVACYLHWTIAMWLRVAAKVAAPPSKDEEA